MNKIFVLIGGYILSTSFVLAQNTPTPQASTPLPWAYALNAPGVAVIEDDGELRRVPNSTQAFLLPDTRDLYNPPDWHPTDHPVMPEIVSKGRAPVVFACGYCHLPNGQGRPENTSLAGLSAEYIIQQMADYRAGLRKGSEPQMGPTSAMQAIGINATEEEVVSAANYFSSLTPIPWIRVVETNTVPKTTIAGWMHVEAEEGEVEAIGQRIVEMPEDLERTELRDSRSGFIAYVPKGSIEKGRELVMAKGETSCTSCHGEDLRGLGPVPALAGRSPSYIVRQLYDFQIGSRAGLWSPLMDAVVSDLSLEDFVAIAAFTASLDP